MKEEIILNNIRHITIQCVKRRLDADCPIGFLLSGGVDSSLVAAISSKIFNSTIKTFCCGFEQGTDLKYAKLASEYIKSNHNEVIMDIDEAISKIDDIIYAVETWDVTTIRASVGQYFVSRYVKNKTDIKVLMIGEGPDEVCSSYLFNYNAPDAQALHNKSIELVQKIHYFDVKRADRCIANNGLEARVPFLDPEFITEYYKIPAEMRMPTYKNFEKYWLRKAFENMNILPQEILWRRKEALSDGISSKQNSWFQILNAHFDKIISNELFSKAEQLYPKNTPKTKEGFYYRQVFNKLFKNRDQIIPHYWLPTFNNLDYVDPSARTLNIYNKLTNQ